MKFYSLLIIFLLASCSSTKKINQKEHTFVSFVILNKDAEIKQKEWKELEGDSFPGLRLIKWYKKKKR